MKFFYSLLLLSLFPLVVFPQHYLDLMNRERVNFFEVQKAAEEYFEGKDRGRGSGYKQFKRWEYQSQRELDPEGYVIPATQVWSELASFQSNYPSPESTNLTGDWKPLGPTNWNRTSGWNPGVGRVVCIAVEPVAQQLIYVGAPKGGLWKTTNAGSTWRPLSDDMAVMDVWSVSIDPGDTSTVYMGTAGGGVMKSTDGGANWTSLPGPSGAVRRILISPTNSNLVFAASSNGVWRSTNAGSNWTKVHFSGVEDMDFRPGNENVVYACGSSFFRSTNNGTSFSTVTVAGSNGQRMKMAVTPHDPNYVYLIQRSGSIFGALFRSTNGGTSFTTRIAYQGPGTGTNFLGYSTTGNDTQGQAWRDMAICVSPTNKEEVHIAGIACWKSLNGGSSFSVTTAWYLPNSIGYNHADVEVLQFVGNNIYSGTDGGIYISTDNADNFTDLSAGLGIREFYRIGCAKTDINVVSGGAQDNGTSVMRGATRSWVDWLGADGMETFVDHSNANNLFGTSQYGSMYRSVNQGNSRFSISKPAGVGNGNWVTPFEQDPIVPTTIYVGFDELYKSTASGSNWTAISNINIGNLDEVAIAPSNNQVIYVANNSTVYKTTNGGTTWTNISSGVSGFVNYISVDPNDPNRVALATSASSSKVLISTNGGSSWVNHTSNLPSIGANCVLLDKTSRRGIYVGMQGAVYYTDDSLANWVSFMSGLPRVRVYELEIQEQAQMIRAGTYGRGLWESPVYPSGSAAPIANLSASATEIVVGDTVHFNDLSLGSPTSRLWDFPGGNPPSSTQASPSVIYHTPGIYDVSLEVGNSIGSDSITQTDLITVKRYCSSEATNSIDSYIRRVQLGSIDNTDLSCATYSDFSHLETGLYRDSTYLISVTTDDCDGGGTYSKGFKVYIDWDSNNEFDEVSEMVFSSPVQASGTFVTAISVPSNAVLGRSGLRIVCSEFNPIQACGTYSYGETEDYTVDIKDTAVCPQVSISTSSQHQTSCMGSSSISLSGGQPSGGSFSGSFVSGGQFDVQAAGIGVHTYYYSYNDGVGCSGLDSGTITVAPLPDISASDDGATPASGDTIYACLSNPGTPLVSLYFLADNIGSLTPPVLGSWTSLSGGSMLNGSNRPQGSPATFSPDPDSLVSTLNLVVEDANGCAAVKAVKVFISPYPNADVQLDQNQVCIGEDTINMNFLNLPAQSFSHTVTRVRTNPPMSPFSQGVVYISTGLEFKNSISFVPGQSLTNPINQVSVPTWFVYQWDFTDLSGCATRRLDSILVGPKPAVTLSNLAGTCINGPQQLLTAGTPSSGVYSGPGVVNGSFDPQIAGIGIHQIVYSYTNAQGCSNSDTNTIEVSGLPNVTLSNQGTTCLNSAPMTLSGGTPSPGTYSGPGVSNGSFFPQQAGVGMHQIVYSFSDNNGCMNSDTNTIEVFAPPNVTLPNLGTTCVNSGFVTLTGGTPASGTYTGPGVSNGSFFPQQAGIGIHRIVYSHTDNNGCVNSDTNTIEVLPLPNVNLPNLGSACVNSGPVILSGGSPAPGTYSGPGVSNGSFFPQQVGVGIYQIVYSHVDINGCVNSDTNTIEVLAPPNVAHPNLVGHCSADPPVTLTGGTPSGGSYSGPGVSGGIFDPSIAGPGLHQLTYTYSNANNCTNSAQFDAPVFSDPGANFDYTVNGPTVSFHDLSSNAASWSWDFGDGSTGLGQNPFHTYASQGTYQVCLSVSSFEGCLNTFCRDVPVISVGLGGELGSSSVQVFPNPFDEEIIIKMDFDHDIVKGLIYDPLGRMIKEVEIAKNSRETVVKLGELPAGSYFLNLSDQSGTLTIPIQKN